MLIISKFTYKSRENRIKLHTPMEDELFAKLKTIYGFGFTRTHWCYYIPYTKQALNELKQIVPDIEILTTKEQTTKATNIQTKDQLKAILSIDKEQKRFFVQPPYNKILWAELRKIEHSFWQKNSKKWIFKGDNNIYKQVCKIIKEHGYTIDIQTEKTLLEKETHPTIRIYIEALTLKNYSYNTTEAYLPHFKQFVANFALQKIEELSFVQINQYVQDTISSNKFEETQIRHLVSAIKFFYEKILGKQKMYFNPPKRYQIVDKKIKLSAEELLPILKQIEDKKEALIALLCLGYGVSAKKLSELTLAEIKKGIENELKKQTPYAKTLKKIVVDYYTHYSPQMYLIENTENKQIMPIEIEAMLHNILQKHKITVWYKHQYKEAAQDAKFEYHTTKNYINLFLSFVKYFGFRHPNNITDNEIRQYLLVCRHEYKLSSSYINNLINSIKFYYTHIAKRKIEYGNLLRPKMEKKLPTVLSTGEVLRMIETTENIKHKNMIALLYASGLRRSELLNMKIKDIDFERNVVIVRGGKGKKDRQTPLAQNLLGIFKQYIDLYQPKEYLFEGATGGRYSERSLERVVKNAAQNAKVVKHVSPHTLRHSFATHLLENAVDIRYIQQLLGHANIKTTERYTHVANVAHTIVLSPLDKLNLSERDTTRKPP